jgi:transposase-like protein
MAVLGTKPPEVEVLAKAIRRRFTAEYKRKILQEADACTDPGAIGALLRREGLYSSNLTTWRAQRERGELAGLTPKKRGPAPKPKNPLAAKVAALEREVTRQTARAERAEALVELQKNHRARRTRPSCWTRNSLAGYPRVAPGGVAVHLLVTSRTRKKTWSGGGVRT